MPIYLYKCPCCKEEYLDYQSKYVGSRPIPCPGNCKIGGINKRVMLQRDYNAEQAAVIPDWEPGYNVGIDYNYTSKADLMSEIRRRGLYPSGHGGGVVNTKSGLYGDEEHKDLYNYSEPEVHEGLENVAPLTK
jgi:hypothetical protein